MSGVAVRYIVSDVDEAIEFYGKFLGFELVMHPAPEFATMTRGDLRLLLSKPSNVGGGGRTMPDGTVPEPGGWNRIQLPIDDLEGQVERLRPEGTTFRTDIVSGVGGRQILIEDPSGNPIELFEYFNSGA